MSSEADYSKMLRDGSLTWISGMDGSKSPSLISRQNYAKGVNLTCRGGPIKPRPGWFNHGLTFASPSVLAGFRSGNFQTALPYTQAGQTYLLSSHGGRQFRIDTQTFSVDEITPKKSFSTTAGSNISVAAGATEAVTVSSVANMTLDLPSITIGGYSLQLIAINSETSITVQNNTANTITVAPPAVVSFVGLDVNNPNQLKNWSLQAEMFWILQDNQSLPIIFDGSKTFRSNPALLQVPTGNVMGYTQGRLAVALPDRRTFAAGNLVKSSSGTAAYGGSDAILYFTDNAYLNTGGDFVARTFSGIGDAGDIKAMIPTAQGDTALGQGPLMVGCPGAWFSLNLPTDDTTWKNLNYPIQTIIPIKGPVGQDMCTMVNTDIWYRSLDGIRSLIIAERQFNNLWANTPQSNELDDFITNDTQFWLEAGSSVIFDNRVLMTVAPQASPSGIWHRGIVVLDFDLNSGLLTRSNPCWEGMWTGLRFLKLFTTTVNNVERCFMYVLNDESQIELWELSTQDKWDNSSVRTPIVWEAEPPAYNFGNSDNFKELAVGRLLVDNIADSFSGTVKYRPDDEVCWQLWDTFCKCAKIADCGPFECSGPNLYRPQSRRPITLNAPPDLANPISGNLFRTGYLFQPRLELTGYGEIQEFRVYALDSPSVLGPDYIEEPACPTPTTYQWWNMAQVATVSCPGGYAGGTASASKAAHTFGSNTSQQDADGQAYAAALEAAQAKLNCVESSPLTGFYVALPITSSPNHCAPSATNSFTFVGEPGYTYNAVLRVRGVMELKPYSAPSSGTAVSGTAYGLLVACASGTQAVPCEPLDNTNENALIIAPAAGSALPAQVFLLNNAPNNLEPGATAWTTTSSNLSVLAGATAEISVASTAALSLLQPNITIGGSLLQLVGIDTTHGKIIVQNNTGSTITHNSPAYVTGTVQAVDYSFTCQLENGATVTLAAYSIDSTEFPNSNNLEANTTPPPAIVPSQPVSGQFVQLDLVSIQ